MHLPLMIATFGALGCLSRYYVSGWTYEVFGRGFAYGTLTVNALGSLLIGLIMEFGLRGDLLSAAMRTGLTIGFLGGFTTFSTFSYETFRMLEDGEFLLATANAVGSLAACLLCTWLGILAARHFL